MGTALQRFIEAGEHRLAELEEPERTIVAARLHNEILRRFPNGIDANPELEFDGNYLFDGPLSDKDVEDKIIQDHHDREDNSTAEDMAEDGCYSDSEGEREPRLPKLKRNPRIDHASASEIKSYNRQLPGERMRSVHYGAGLEFATESTPITDDGDGDDEGVPDFLDGLHDMTSCQRMLTAFSAASDVSEGDSLGDHFIEKHADHKPTRPYHDRIAKVMFRQGQTWKKTPDARAVCEHCGEEFEGRKGAKYCSANCRKRAHEASRIVKR